MARYLTFELRPGDLTASRPRVPKRTPGLFVAFKFGSPLGEQFRSDLERFVRSSERLAHLEISDGRTSVGQHWPSEIRDRLMRSALVIAHLKPTSTDVLYESGFGWGVGCPLLPVVQSKRDLDLLPRWLTDIQVGTMETANGWPELFASIDKHLRDKSGRQGTAQPKPDPNYVRYVAAGPSADLIRQKTDYLALRTDLNVDRLPEDPSEDDTLDALKSVAKASLLIAPIQGTSSDFFVHFASGTMAAKPTSGASRAKLQRRVILVVEGAQGASLVAESLRRYGKFAKVITAERLEQEIADFLDAHTVWRERNS